MKIQKHLLKPFLCFIMLFLFCSKGHSQTILPTEETARIDSIMNGLIKKYNITGASMAIVDGNNIVYSTGYGFADRKNKIAADENTIYGIGSITKTFTALCVMKLWEEGKIDLDKPASFYLPELKMADTNENTDILKIKNLLTHTSGLPDDVKNGDMCSSPPELSTLVNELNKQVLIRPADWKMNYSNIGYALLGLIVERVSGMEYEDYVRQNILKKIPMVHTGFELKKNNRQYSKGYLKDSTETAEPLLRDVPAGGLYSNVIDMSKFMTMILNNGQFGNAMIVKSSTIENMENDHIHDVVLNADEKFGYGLFIERMYNAEDSITGEGVGHAGDVITYHSTMFMFPRLNIGFVVLTNSEQGHDFCNSSLIKLFYEYVQKVKGIKLHNAGGLKYSDQDLRRNIDDDHEIAGVYTIGQEGYVVIKNRGDHKLLFKQNHTRLTLKKQENNSYTAKLHLLKFFRLKVKGLRFAFEKIGGNIYLKQLNDKLKAARYITMKDPIVPISTEWQNMVGHYEPVNSCEGNYQGVPSELKIEKNKLILVMDFPDGEKDAYSFDQITNTLAAIDGIDRGCGMIMKILPSGYLYFSGYELQKTDAK